MGLSLRDLAERSEVSAPMLSQVERGETSPTLVGRRPDRLRPRADPLAAAAARRGRARRRHPRRATGAARRRGGHLLEELTPPLPGQRADVSMHTLKPRREHRRPGRSARCTSRAARETAVVLEGTAELVVDGERHELGEGDSVTFDADLPHHFENNGHGEARFVAVVAAGLRRRMPLMAKSLFDKIWESHEVAEDLIYIDLHLVHEVTSAQAFEGLRLGGSRRSAGPTRPWRPPTTTSRPTAPPPRG